MELQLTQNIIHIIRWNRVMLNFNYLVNQNQRKHIGFNK